MQQKILQLSKTYPFFTSDQVSKRLSLYLKKSEVTLPQRDRALNIKLENY